MDLALSGEIDGQPLLPDTLSLEKTQKMKKIFFYFLKTSAFSCSQCLGIYIWSAGSMIEHICR